MTLEQKQNGHKKDPKKGHRKYRIGIIASFTLMITMGFVPPILKEHGVNENIVIGSCFAFPVLFWAGYFLLRHCIDKNNGTW